MEFANRAELRVPPGRGRDVLRWLAPALALTAVACAAPARRLTPRVVDDPIVLPRRMAQVMVGAGVRHLEPGGGVGHWSTSSIRFGITDRLEWTDVLQLRYALLDDRPADGRAPRPLSLALRAGLYGIGYSSTMGVLAYPTVAVEALKHLGLNWALGASLSWLATWSERETSLFQYPSDLAYRSGSRRSYWSLRGFATRQLTDRFALSFSAWYQHTGACISPTCDWIMESTGGLLHLQFRPWHWMTLSAGPYGGWQHRPNVLPPPSDPSAPAVPPPPLSATWMGLSARVAFHW